MSGDHPRHDAPDLAEAAALQQADHDAYRRSPYPAGLHPQIVPDRLAVIARLAGMRPADIRTARVLDIGTGNGMQLLALAAAYPEARFVGIDVVEDAIEQGRGWAAKACLGNVDLRVGDLLDGGNVEGEFDYITAHGVFAWVPPAVADALLALIGRHLAPQGVAMVSYNALPGSYIRMALRDRMMAAAGDEVDPDRRVELARGALAPMAAARDTDAPAQAAFRFHARQAMEGNPGVLLHDELSGNFNPRYCADVIREAAAHDLAFLGDAHAGMIADAFLPGSADPAGDHDAQAIHNATERDWSEVHFFHHTMLVRRDAAPRRTLDIDVLADLYVTSRAVETEPHLFSTGDDRALIRDPILHATLQRIIDAAPHRLRVSELDLDMAHLKAIFGLFDSGIVDLHDLPERFATSPGATPTTSPLIRLMIEEGMPWIATLDHRQVRLDPAVQRVLLALDGSGDEQALGTAAKAAGLETPDALAEGIADLAQLGVFVA